MDARVVHLEPLMRNARAAHRFVAVVAISFVLVAGTALAQDRLFVGTGELGAFGRFGERIGEAPGAVYGEFVAGGRYVAWGGRLIFDTRTGRAIAAEGGSVVGVDPRLPRIFVNDGATLAVFDLGTRVATALLPVAAHDPRQAPVAMARVAHDANELFVLRTLPTNTFVGGPSTPAEFVVIDLGTGSVKRSITVEPPGLLPLIYDWHPTSEGHRIILNSLNHVALADAVSGAVLNQVDLGVGAGGSGRIIDDRERRRYYLAEFGRLTVFDDNLAFITQVPIYNGSCVPASLDFSPHTRRFYITEPRGGGSGGPGNFMPPTPLVLTLSVFDADSGRRLASRDVAAATGPLLGYGSCEARPVKVVTAPGAPQGLAVTVTGRDVTLTWTNVGDASEFVLDVGVAPGRTDATLGLGTAAPVTLTNAPPGRYNVRVRGTNAFGVSRPSNEVTVLVP